MNKRIQELTKQAGISILYEYDGYDGHAAVANLADIEKFAELIVQECAGIYSKIDNGNSHLGTDDYLTALVKHFGVEE